MVQVTKRVRAGLVVALLPAAVAAQPAAAQLSVPPSQIQSYSGDPGKSGDPASWRTPEFLRDNGMLSIGAEFAYAAGYAGGGMNVGIVDSGVFAGHLVEHGDRYFSVEAQGGETGPTPGWYDPAFNDSHGTHVSGTVGASREGVGETTPAGPEANMHGVAFNSDIYTGNTAKTDGVFYGLLPATATLAQKIDNAYVENVYRAVNAARTRNGKPIRLITSSWGSQPPTENYNTYDGLNTAWRFLSTPDGAADPNGNTSHWLNGAIEVARTGTILQFTAGNSGYVNPTPRGAAPYFLPDLEGRWYTTSGINPGVGRTLNLDGSVLVPGTQEFNQCGRRQVVVPDRAEPGDQQHLGRARKWCAAAPLPQRVGHLDGRAALGRCPGADHAALPVHDQRAGAVHDVHDRPPERDDQRRGRRGDPEPGGRSEGAGAGCAQRLEHGQPEGRGPRPRGAARALHGRHARLQRRVVQRHLRRRDPRAPG